MEKLEVPEKLELTETQKTPENTNSKSVGPGSFDGIEQVVRSFDRMNFVLPR